MRCDLCYQSEPTAYVELHHNVGMLFLRREYTTQGELCRGCLSRAFWHHTLRNLTLGWWGTISFFMTWYFLASNLVTYVQARGELAKAAPRRAAPKPVASGEEARRILEPFEHNVRMRLRDGEASEAVAQDLARYHGVELASAQRFVEQLREAA
ncbi:hypothetical protein JQX13_12650 [Archangium violaceum]|uniref:hypothetical protein n=1 Tax=Archangium violaceum TaxID=83451 RepID=UPI00193B5601|nr:hypothetical protein [Archangium violaceum]QRK10841.1 hypothetical protein JQX13_12650 [Archangium violaceum]